VGVAPKVALGKKIIKNLIFIYCDVSRLETLSKIVKKNIALFSKKYQMSPKFTGNRVIRLEGLPGSSMDFRGL
jgi:hypothetical protein